MEEKIAAIVAILKSVEYELSDGYSYYGDTEVDDRLREIAKLILAKLSQQMSTSTPQ